MNPNITEYVPRDGWMKYQKRLERKRRICAFFVDMVVFGIATYLIFFLEAL